MLQAPYLVGQVEKEGRGQHDEDAEEPFPRTASARGEVEEWNDETADEQSAEDSKEPVESRYSIPRAQRGHVIPAGVLTLAKRVPLVPEHVALLWE
jgi:hypothetical protein